MPSFYISKDSMTVQELVEALGNELPIAFTNIDTMMMRVPLATGRTCFIRIASENLMVVLQ